MDKERNRPTLEIEQRLALLQLAEEIGVAEACQKFGVTDRTLRNYRKAWRAGGVEALRPRSRAHHGHPQTTPLFIRKIVCAKARRYPHRSCDELAGIVSSAIPKHSTSIMNSISGVTVRKILREENLYFGARRTQAPLKQPSNQLSSFLTEDKTNPAFKERESYYAPEKPGHSLCQSIFTLRRYGSFGTIYVQAVVDIYSGMGWAQVFEEKTAHDALVLLKEVIRFFNSKPPLSIKNILTSRRREFFGPLPNYLLPKDLFALKTKKLDSDIFLDQEFGKKMQKKKMEKYQRRVSEVEESARLNKNLNEPDAKEIFTDHQVNRLANEISKRDYFHRIDLDSTVMYRFRARHYYYLLDTHSIHHEYPDSLMEELPRYESTKYLKTSYAERIGHKYNGFFARFYETIQADFFPTTAEKATM